MVPCEAVFHQANPYFILFYFILFYFIQKLILQLYPPSLVVSIHATYHLRSGFAYAVIFAPYIGIFSNDIQK